MSFALRCDGCGRYAPAPPIEGPVELPEGWAVVEARLGRHGFSDRGLPGSPAHVCSPACGEHVIREVLERERHARAERLLAARAAAAQGSGEVGPRESTAGMTIVEAGEAGSSA